MSGVGRGSSTALQWPWRAASSFMSSMISLRYRPRCGTGVVQVKGNQCSSAPTTRAPSDCCRNDLHGRECAVCMHACLHGWEHASHMLPFCHAGARRVGRRTACGSAAHAHVVLVVLDLVQRHRVRQHDDARGRRVQRHAGHACTAGQGRVACIVGPRGSACKLSAVRGRKPRVAGVQECRIRATWQGVWWAARTCAC